MLGLDTKLAELEKNNTPIRVGLIGAGTAARSFANQLLKMRNGMRLSAIANRRVSQAQKLLDECGTSDTVEPQTQIDFDIAVGQEKVAVTNNSRFIYESNVIDVVVEATGTIEYAAHIVLSAIQNKKHVVLINAELDTTLGPILKVYADKANVVYTQADGDQPAVLANLYREVKLLGLTPVLAGNIKSLIDPYRTPATQKNWATANSQKPYIATTFADGTKISQEMATVANAIGFKVGKRGMHGPKCAHVTEAQNLYDVAKLKQQGLVDYLLGAEPSFGVFILAINDDPIRKQYLKMYKMGEGPLFTFYRPYHLSGLEAPLSVARAFLYNDAALAPTAGPICDVIAVAKKDLKKGEVLDGIGGFTVYGVIENAPIVKHENLLPIGLSAECIMARAVSKDTPITYADVILPKNRLADKLRGEQEQVFAKHYET